MAQGTERQMGVDQLQLAIPAEPGYIAMSRMFAAAVARHYGADEDVVEDLKVAVSEACTNSVKAHREGGTTEPIQLRARQVDDAIEFQIVDSGIGIDPDLQAAADSAITPAAGLYEGSLGLTLIRSLFPSAEIVRNEDRGTTVRFLVPVGDVTAQLTD